MEIITFLVVDMFTLTKPTFSASSLSAGEFLCLDRFRRAAFKNLKKYWKILHVYGKLKVYLRDFEKGLKITLSRPGVVARNLITSSTVLTGLFISGESDTEDF